MELLEDKPCKYCKAVFTPRVEWQKFCPKKEGEQSCHNKYWKEVYRDRAAVNRRLEKVEKELGIN